MKVPYLLFSLLCLGLVARAQTDFKAVSLGLTYAQPDRPEVTTYFAAISDSLRLKAPLRCNQQVGFALNFLAHSGRGEFQFGISYAATRNIQSGDSGSYQVLGKTRDIGINFGGNYFPTNWFLIGGHAVINSFGGDLKQFGDLPAAQSSLLTPAPDDINIFRGYSMLLRAQAGFRIPTRSDKNNAIRLLGYYDIGTQFNFQRSFERQFAAYTGSLRTGTHTWGIVVQVDFEMK
jgi:hypothetical protein